MGLILEDRVIEGIGAHTEFLLPVLRMLRSGDVARQPLGLDDEDAACRDYEMVDLGLAQRLSGIECPGGEGEVVEDLEITVLQLSELPHHFSFGTTTLPANPADTSEYKEEGEEQNQDNPAADETDGKRREGLDELRHNS